MHGFPKVMGVLTHLDTFKDPKRLRKTKKALKARWPHPTGSKRRAKWGPQRPALFRLAGARSVW